MKAKATMAIAAVAVLLAAPTLASPPVPASTGFGVPGVPSFATYPIPDDIKGGPLAGEPTLGIPWNTDHLFFQAGSHTFKAVFDDAKEQAGAASVAWTSVGPAFNVVNVDPMLNADPVTNRIWAGGLEGACSVMGISDDDGATWLPAGNMCNFYEFDHQSIGSGPWAKGGLPRPTMYDRATYYCSQQSFTACSTSLDGGFAWLPPAQVLGGCGGLHGHIRVSEITGFAAVPDGSCNSPDSPVVQPELTNGDKVGFGFTKDNGLNWGSRLVSESTSGTHGFDPSLQFGRDKGWLYLGAADDSGIHVAMSKDEGLTWETLGNATPGAKPAAWFDLAPLFHDPKTGSPLKFGSFADVQVGDDDRAAFAFLGTTNPDGQHPFDDCSSASDGNIWHYYLAQTLDAGATWTVTRVSDDPIQVGAIWDGGGIDACRNLSDFNDMDIDSHGRIHIGFSDGCTKTCLDKYNAWQAGKGPAPTGTDSRDRHGTVFRQTTGLGLFAKDDAPGQAGLSSSSSSMPAKGSPGPELGLLALAVAGAVALKRRR